MVSSLKKIGPSGSLARLCEAIRKSRLVLRRFREERVAIVKEYVGHHWSEEGARLPVPLNLIAMYCNVVGRSLIAKNPRVMLSTFDRSQKATVQAEQLWVNRELEAIDFARTEGRAVLDALIGGPGFVKVALATPSDSAVAAWDLPVGNPFAEIIDFDDIVFDIHARDFREVGYIGHRYRVPIDTVRDSRLYLAARKDLEATPDNFYNAEGDLRVSTLGREFYSNEEEYEDMVDLWEIYVPRRGVVFTLSDLNLSGPNAKVLREQKWVGPDIGPYHELSLGGAVPDNAISKSPCQDLIDLHLACNNMLRKLIRQAANMKQNIFVAGGADQDGSRVLKANDGDIVKVDNPQNISSPGAVLAPNQQLFGLLMQFKEFFSWEAGNLDMLAGLSPQSKTATQDELLAKSAGAQVSDMQKATLKHTSQVVKALLWYWHHHPTLNMQVHQSIPGTGLSIPRRASPKDRGNVRLADMDIRVDPYSLTEQTPESRLAAMQQVVQTTVLPMMQLMVQQGITLDLNQYLTKVGQFMDDPDLAEILTIMEPPTGGEGGGSSNGGPAPGNAATMPSQTTRTYNRVSSPGRTPSGDARNLASTLMGANPGGAPNGQQQGMMK